MCFTYCETWFSLIRTFLSIRMQLLSHRWSSLQAHHVNMSPSCIIGGIAWPQCGEIVFHIDMLSGIVGWEESNGIPHQGLSEDHHPPWAVSRPLLRDVWTQFICRTLKKQINHVQCQSWCQIYRFIKKILIRNHAGCHRSGFSLLELGFRIDRWKQAFSFLNDAPDDYRWIILLKDSNGMEMLICKQTSKTVLCTNQSCFS